MCDGFWNRVESLVSVEVCACRHLRLIQTAVPAILYTRDGQQWERRLHVSDSGTDCSELENGVAGIRILLGKPESDSWVFKLSSFQALRQIC